MNTLIDIVNKLWHQVNADPYNFRSNISEVIVLFGINDTITIIDRLSRSLLVNEYQKVISDIQANIFLENAVKRGVYVSQNGIEFQKKIDALKNLISNYNEWKNEI